MQTYSNFGKAQARKRNNNPTDPMKAKATRLKKRISVKIKVETADHFYQL